MAEGVILVMFLYSDLLCFLGNLTLHSPGFSFLVSLTNISSLTAFGHPCPFRDCAVGICLPQLCSLRLFGDGVCVHLGLVFSVTARHKGWKFNQLEAAMWELYKDAVRQRHQNNNNNNNLFSLSCTNCLVLCSLPHVGYITIILFK